LAAGLLQALNGAEPEQQFRVDRIFHHDGNAGAPDGLGDFLDGERVDGGSGADPEHVDLSPQGGFRMLGIGDFDGDWNAGFLSRLDQPGQGYFAATFEGAWPCPRLPNSCSEQADVKPL